MLNEVLESCEEWHSLIILLTASVAPTHKQVNRSAVQII